MEGPPNRKHPITRCLAALVAVAASISAVAQAPPVPASRFVVLLDAAHGGGDLGGRLTDQAGQVQAEKALTLAFSVRLRSLLSARGIAVVTTRESDAMVENDRRAEIANRANAAACISLHTSQTGSGVHIYTSSLSPVTANQMNPWKTTQAAWVTRSLALAGVLNSALTHAGMTVTLGRTGLPAIDSMACPAVAVEVAPEVSPDRTQPTGVDDPGYQARVAQALAAAIVEWRSNGWRSDTSHPEVQQP